MEFCLNKGHIEAYGCWEQLFVSNKMNHYNKWSGQGRWLRQCVWKILLVVASNVLLSFFMLLLLCAGNSWKKSCKGMFIRNKIYEFGFCKQENIAQEFAEMHSSWKGFFFPKIAAEKLRFWKQLQDRFL